jgi:hypothetical protein
MDSSQSPVQRRAINDINVNTEESTTVDTLVGIFPGGDKLTRSDGSLWDWLRRRATGVASHHPERRPAAGTTVQGVAPAQGLRAADDDPAEPMVRQLEALEHVPSSELPGGGEDQRPEPRRVQDESRRRLSGLHLMRGVRPVVGSAPPVGTLTIEEFGLGDPRIRKFALLPWRLFRGDPFWT